MRRRSRSTCRLATQADAFAVRSLSADPSSLILGPSQFQDAPGVLGATLLPGREKAWVARDSRGAVGFLQARPRGYVLGWEIVRLHVRSDADPEPLSGTLVQHVLAYLQERGIPRLFARTQPGSQGQAVIGGCGFSLLTSECFLIREPSKIGPPDEMPVGMRYRMPQDAWPLRQLENSQTPPLVSELEGLTSLSWSMPSHRRWARNEQCELVVEREGQLVGWVGWKFHRAGRRETARLGLLTGVDESDMASSLVQYALHLIGNENSHASVIIRLRDYQMASEMPFKDLGFEEACRESLHIKHGRLQFIPRKSARLLEFVPTVHAFSIEPTSE